MTPGSVCDESSSTLELIASNPANSRVSLPVYGKGGDPGIGVDRDALLAMPEGHGYASVMCLMSSLNSSYADEGDVATEPRLEAVLPVQDEKVRAALRAAVHGLRARQEPSAARDGMGGTYFFCDAAGAVAAIFKPCDEEPLAPNNPKGWEGRALGAPGYKPCVRVGEAALREAAAYLLDGGFAGVPPACLARCIHPVLNYKVPVMPAIESLMDVSALQHVPSPSTPPPAAGPAVAAALPAAATAQRQVTRSPGGLARALSRASLTPHPAAVDPPSASSPPRPLRRHPKLGSLQAYVPHICDASDMSPSHFAAENVHRIGILDIRILNCDRHLGNLLVAEPPAPPGPGPSNGGAPGGDEVFGARAARHRLVPIDHGYALPEALVDPFFEWLYWPQTELPFSDAVRRAVAAFDFAADAAMLRRALPALRDECLRCLEVTTTLVKMTVAAGLTLHEIGRIVTRSHHLGQPILSDLEVMCADARAEAIAASTPPSGLTSRSASLASPALSWHEAGGGGCARSSGGALFAIDSVAEEPGAGEVAGVTPFAPPTAAIEAPSRSLTPGESVCADAVGGCCACELTSPCMCTTPGDGASLALCSAVPPEGMLVSPPYLSTLATSMCGTPLAAPLPRALLPSLTAIPAPPCGGPAMRELHADCNKSLPMALAAAGLLSSGASTTGGRGRSGYAPSAATTAGGGGAGAAGAAAGGGDRRSAIQRRAAWRMRKNAGGAARHPLGVHPDGANYVFTGLSDAQWLVFMDRIREYVGQELAEGTWRVKRHTGRIATTAPVHAFLPRSP